MNNIIVIPRHSVIVRFIDIPSMDEAEIRRMVEFQAIKEIPYPKEEMIFGCRNLGSYRDGFSSLMLVVAKREMIERVMRENDLKGLKVEGIRLHSELLYLFLLKKQVLKQDKANLIIHIGRDESEIMIADKTRPVFSRGFKNSDRFFEEIDRSIHVYKRDKLNPEIENIVIAHPSDVDIKTIRPHTKEHFSIPVDFHEYADDLTDAGLSAEIDLLPQEFTDKNTKQQKRQGLIITYSLIGFIIILFFASVFFKIHEKNKLLGMLSARVEEIQSRTGDLDELLKKITIAKKHRDEGSFIIDILKESRNLIPADISLTGMSYDGKKAITYKGISKDTSNVFSFVKKLEKSELFNSVEIKHTTKKRVKGKEITDFNIQCRLGRL